MSKIKRIEIKDWIGISELPFSPGKINKISGDSGAGKTSIVEAMEKAFTNISRRIEVIRHDTSEAEIFVELDNGLQITRKIRTDKNDYLKVKHDSIAVTSTEGFLKKMINGELFRPIEFVGKSKDDQTKEILNMLEIGWTSDDIVSWFGEIPQVDYKLHILRFLKQIEELYYSERTSINSEITHLKANIQGIKRDLPPNYDGEQWRNVELKVLYDKLSDAEANNKRLADARQVIDGLNIRLDDIKQRAANATETKALEYSRQRDTLNSAIKRLGESIETEQIKINDVDVRISAEALRLDQELEQAIERLKNQYQAKKLSAKESIQQEGEQSRTFLSEYSQQLVEKQGTLANLDELEKKDLDAIAVSAANLTKAENEKTGNAQKAIDEVEEIPIEPLKQEANTAAEMIKYLREWERMNEIIKEKLAPKEARSADLTAKIQKARELPVELLKTASIPVDGLTVDEKGRIRINETLIDGLSEGESLDFAFKLAKAQAGELKVICVDGWNKLGSKQQEIIDAAMTDEYQYFLLDTVPGEELKIEILED